jgi:hypothetical protein
MDRNGRLLASFETMIGSGRKLAWSLTGIAWFLWLAFEDRNLTAVIILSALIAGTSGIEVYWRWKKNQTGIGSDAVRVLLIGVISGALVAPFAAILVMLKTALHQHPVSDFSAADLQILIGRIPIWTLVGGLLGAARAIWGLKSTSGR